MTLRHGQRLVGPKRLKELAAARWIFAVPLILALLIAAGWYHYHSSHNPARPDRLSGYHLGGTRDDLNCLRLVIAVDVSGSMRDFAVPRDDALVQLFAWVKGTPTTRNLQVDDQVAIVDFAAVALTRMVPVTVGDLGTLPGATGAKDGEYTYFTPILDRIAAFPNTTCDTDLVLISDAQLEDLPSDSAAGQALMRRYAIDKVRLLVPGAAIKVPAQWQESFPSARPSVFDGTDAKSTGLAFGHTIANLTGQTLVPRKR
jgi:hypothetical protein